MPTSNTAGPSPPSMAGLIQGSVRRTPGRVAVGVADGSLRLSYGELSQLVLALAGQIAQAGISGAGPIALYSDNRPEFVVALLAAWTSGRVVVPVNPQLTGAEVRARLAAADARAVLVPGRLRDSFAPEADATPAWAVDVDGDRPDVTMTSMRQSPSAGRGAPLAPGPAASLAQDPGHALLMFTTGSTGAPKIVPLTHVNLAASVSGIVSSYHLGSDDATLVTMPLFHGHGLVGGLLATLASSGAAYLPAAGRFSAHVFWDEITYAKATWYTAVPTVHEILLARAATDYPAASPPALRFIRSSSAPLAPAIVHRTQEQFGVPVISAYGMTETAHQAATNPLPDDGPRKDASVGLPTGLQIRITTGSGGPATLGETGQIWLRGPAVADGYLNDAGATAAAFVDGWFRTGDLGYLDADGYLFLSGRTKDMINRGGEKIAPLTVEAALLSDPAVLDALAFPVPDAKYGEEVNAAVILQPGQHATQADLQDHCRAQLSAFEIPKKIYFLDRFPRTSKGDGDRRALTDMFAGPRAGLREGNRR